jgi:hypothetical protein
VSVFGAEALRRAALAALGEHADERARDALAHASLTVIEAAGWDGSAGPVEAHRVTLGLDARTLGGLRAAPAVVDALCAALATAISARPGDALLDLRLLWTPAARPAAAGYRDAPPPEHGDSLQAALVAYLDGAGERSLSDLVATAIVYQPPAGPIALELPPSVRDALRADPRALAVVTAALRDLRADPETRVRVR